MTEDNMQALLFQLESQANIIKVYVVVADAVVAIIVNILCVYEFYYCCHRSRLFIVIMTQCIIKDE